MDIGISFAAKPLSMSRSDEVFPELYLATANHSKVSTSGKDKRSSGLDALVEDLSKMQSHTKADADPEVSSHGSLPAPKSRISEDCHSYNSKERYLHTHLNVVPDELSGRVRDEAATEGDLDTPLRVSSPAEDGMGDVISIERTESVESDAERATSMEEIGRHSRGSSKEEDGEVRPVSSMSAPAAIGDEEGLPDTTSMEALMELLKEREKEVGTGMGTPAGKEGSRPESGLGNRKEPLSSTPASRSSDPPPEEGDSAVVTSQDDFDCGSVTSLASLPEGTFLGEARHKDGSLLAIIFQVGIWILYFQQSLEYCVWMINSREDVMTRSSWEGA